jgi:hypothetical protein
VIGKAIEKVEELLSYGGRDPKWMVICRQFGLGIRWKSHLMLLRRVSFPDFCEPSLPSPADKPPAGTGWLHEIKHDGFRMLVRRDAVPLQSVIRRRMGELRHEIHSSPSCVAVGSDIERRGNPNVQTPVGAGVA